MPNPHAAEPLLPTARKPPEHENAVAKRKLLIGAGLCFLFMLFEIIGGFMAHSLAVMTDAAHMLSDVAGFIVSVLALLLSSRAADAKYSFGYHRAEVLGALASILVVWLMTGCLIYEAIQRLITPVNAAADRHPDPPFYWPVGIPTTNTQDRMCGRLIRACTAPCRSLLMARSCSASPSSASG